VVRLPDQPARHRARSDHCGRLLVHRVHDGHRPSNTWCQNYDGGRSWYTGLGHTIESFTEGNFLHLLLGGIQTAAGVVPANCSVAVPSGVSLRAHANGKYVTAENAGATALVANRTAIGPWEEFDLIG
jgi:hypothetical protein